MDSRETPMYTELKAEMATGLTKAATSAPTMNAKDRCDRDQGEQAYVRVYLTEKSTELLFCNHHWNMFKNHPSMLKAYVVTDETDRINTPRNKD